MLAVDLAQQGFICVVINPGWVKTVMGGGRRSRSTLRRRGHGFGWLSVQLGRAAGRPCDVVVLERASPVLAMEVVRHGRRVFCRDEQVADAWEDSALRRYLGTAHLRRMVTEALREDLARGGR